MRVRFRRKGKHRFGEAGWEGVPDDPPVWTDTVEAAHVADPVDCIARCGFEDLAFGGGGGDRAEQFAQHRSPPVRGRAGERTRHARANGLAK